MDINLETFVKAKRQASHVSNVNKTPWRWCQLQCSKYLHFTWAKIFLIEFSICGAAMNFFSVYCPKSQKSHTQRRLNEKQRDREWKNIVNVMRFAIIASSLLRNSCGIHDLSLICHERQVKEKRISMALIYDSSRNVEGILKTSTSLFYLFMV